MYFLNTPQLCIKMSHILHLHKVLCKLALAIPLVYLLTNPNLHIGSANETYVLLLIFLLVLWLADLGFHKQQCSPDFIILLVQWSNLKGPLWLLVSQDKTVSKSLFTSKWVTPIALQLRCCSKASISTSIASPNLALFIALE